MRKSAYLQATSLQNQTISKIRATAHTVFACKTITDAVILTKYYHTDTATRPALVLAIHCANCLFDYATKADASTLAIKLQQMEKMWDVVAETDPDTISLNTMQECRELVAECRKHCEMYVFEQTQGKDEENHFRHLASKMPVKIGQPASDGTLVMS